MRGGRSVSFNERTTEDLGWKQRHSPAHFNPALLFHSPTPLCPSSALQAFASFELIKYNVEQDEPVRNEDGFCIRVRPGKKSPVMAFTAGEPAKKNTNIPSGAQILQHQGKRCLAPNPPFPP